MTRLPAWVFILILVGGVFGTSVAAMALYRTTQQLALDSGATGLQLPSVAELVAGTGTREETTHTLVISGTPMIPDEESTTESEITPVEGLNQQNPTAVPIQIAPENEVVVASWDDPRRITMLLMGIDERIEVNAIPSPNTDSMILVSVDPVSQRAAVLSLPRDLWVTIPGFAHGRINTAYKLGATSNYPGGGPGLAKDTVAQNLGVTVDYHVRVNFVAFEETIDAIFPRGVQVCVEEEIHDPDYPDAGYGTIEVYFPIGCQRLDGQRLLQYARTRATYDGDFGRSARQQQVLRAVQSEILSVGGVVNLILQLPSLWSQLSEHFETNLQVEQISDLLALLGEMDTSDVVYEIVDERYVEFGTTATGEQVLVPRQNGLSELAAYLLNPQESFSLEELRTLAAEETARIAVMNGAGLEGLAAAVGNHLSLSGLEIYTIGNAAQQDYERTVIQHDGTALWTARYIAALFQWGDEHISVVAEESNGSGVIVMAGRDLTGFLTDFNQRTSEAN